MKWNVRLKQRTLCLEDMNTAVRCFGYHYFVLESSYKNSNLKHLLRNASFHAIEYAINSCSMHRSSRMGCLCLDLVSLLLCTLSTFNNFIGIYEVSGVRPLRFVLLGHTYPNDSGELYSFEHFFHHNPPLRPMLRIRLPAFIKPFES